MSAKTIGKICLSKICMPFGIRQKMLLVLMSVLICASTVTGYFALQAQEQEILNATQRRGVEISKYLSEAIALHVVGYDYHSIQIMLDELISSNDIQHASVRSVKNNVMASSGKAYSGIATPQSFSQIIYFDNKKVGELQIELNNKDIVARLERERKNLFNREIITIIFIVLGEFIALSYFIARPVTMIASTLENSIDEKGRITQDIEITSNDEFGQLANQFNKLRSQLNDAHSKLENKIDVADRELISNNQLLKKQSDELIKINEELEVLSITDPLTGAFNRRHFEATVEDDIARSERTGDINSLIIIDLDHFKLVNDNYGHQNGDTVLKVVSDILVKDIRKTDVLCRIGGEEFVLLCRNTDKAGSLIMAEKIRSDVEKENIRLGTEIIKITTSLGVTTIDPATEVPTLDKYFKMADMALYFSKENGRNRITHYSDIDTQARKVM